MAYSGFPTVLLLLVVVLCHIPFSISSSASLPLEHLCKNRMLALFFGSSCSKYIKTDIDCEVSEWTLWVASPGGCEKSRQRSVKTFARNRGAACPNLTETTTTCTNFTISGTDRVQEALAIFQTGLGGFGSVGPSFPIPGRTIPVDNETSSSSADSNKTRRSLSGNRSNVTPTKTPTLCPPYRDIVLVVDSSGSVGPAKFRKALEDLGRLIPYLCGFQPGVITTCRSVRLALVTYGSEPRLVFDLNHSKTNHAYQINVQSDINDLPQYLSALRRRTATGDALQFVADRVLQRQHGMRSYSNRTILLLTDGKSNKGRNPVDVSKSLYNEYENLSIVALGIGNKINYEELKNMTNHRNEYNPLVLLLRSQQDFTNIVVQIILSLQQGQSKCDVDLLAKKRK
ncbi:uncharacterized protein LOC134189926 [Corticium candelabrum]|uniref:uncharacterized protein LOC134189926 n=1 Tax=Corticium candelabrum TaxID=121492 RepID=UPI002E27260C|nr:uncharacterized protein LOC134189926 [Corticium candelabrum]